jgi:hypothetical protein
MVNEVVGGERLSAHRPSVAAVDVIFTSQAGSFQPAAGFSELHGKKITDLRRPSIHAGLRAVETIEWE